LKYGFTFHFFIYSILITSLIIVSFIDFKYRIIPNVISIPGIPLGLIASFFLNDVSFLSSLIGVILAVSILGAVSYGYYLFTGSEGMGMGDIKLLAMLGAFLGWKSVPFIIFFSSLTGTLVGLTVIFFMKKGRKYPIPFGPFLSLAGIVYLFFGDRLITLFLYLY
ncbi:MAG: A24 family peptidase, partial [Thermodesulfobacteriota bacterium]|nr:A24 family peptidase [Thermodesulfobacteriota bacterium]